MFKNGNTEKCYHFYNIKTPLKISTKLNMLGYLESGIKSITVLTDVAVSKPLSILLIVTFAFALSILNNAVLVALIVLLSLPSSLLVFVLASVKVLSLN